MFLNCLAKRVDRDLAKDVPFSTFCVMLASVICLLPGVFGTSRP